MGALSERNIGSAFEAEGHVIAGSQMWTIRPVSNPMSVLVSGCFSFPSRSWVRSQGGCGSGQGFFERAHRAEKCVTHTVIGDEAPRVFRRERAPRVNVHAHTVGEARPPVQRMRVIIDGAGERIGFGRVHQALQAREQAIGVGIEYNDLRSRLGHSDELAHGRFLLVFVDVVNRVQARHGIEVVVRKRQLQDTHADVLATLTQLQARLIERSLRDVDADTLVEPFRVFKVLRVLNRARSRVEEKIAALGQVLQELEAAGPPT